MEHVRETREQKDETAGQMGEETTMWKTKEKKRTNIEKEDKHRQNESRPATATVESVSTQSEEQLAGRKDEKINSQRGPRRRNATKDKGSEAQIEHACQVEGVQDCPVDKAESSVKNNR